MVDTDVSIGGPVSFDQIRVLHVDDESDIADLTADFLEREDERFAVETAASVGEGLERLAENGFDCVVSDYDMPGRNGIEFLHSVRDEYPDLPFLLFTGRGSEEVASEAIAAGVTDYLQKESGTDQYVVLANRIKNSVAQYRTEQRTSQQERALTLLRNLNQALVGASTRTDIEDAVTDILATADPYQLAWIGEYDAEWDRIVPQAVAGVDDEAVSPTALPEEMTQEGALRTVIRTNDVTITYRDDPTLNVWTDDSAPISHEAAAVLPIVYHGERHGLLTLYAEQSDSLDDTERRLLDEIASDIAQAMHTAKTHQTLKRSETAVEAIPEGVFILDEDARVVLANENAASLVGRTSSEIRGELFPAFVEEGIFDESVIDWYLDSVRELLSSTNDRTEARYQTEVKPPAADPRFVEIHLTLRPYDEEYSGTVGVIRSISDRKQKERELRRKERQLAAVFEDPQMLVGVLDPDGTLRDANQTAMELVDAELTDVTGVPFWETPWWTSEAREDVERWVKRAAAGEYVEYDATNAHLHGDLYSVKGIIRPVRDESGGVTSLIVSARDISARKKREEGIAALHDVTRSLIQADSHEEIADIAVETARDILEMPINGVWLYDDTKNVLEPTAATREAIELLDSQPVFEPGQGISWQVFESQESKVLQDVSKHPRLYNPETPIRAEIILPLGDHGVVNLGSTEVGAFDETDVSMAQILAANAEAALTRADSRRELARQNERLDEFVSVVSHDLRNPLNVAQGRLELVAEDCDSEQLAVVERAHGRMETMIDDLLTLAREGQTISESESVALAELVEGCWQNVETAEATLLTDTSGAVQADRGRLQQLLENLIRNAVEHGGATVTVTVGDLEDGFYVEDDGTGIPEAKGDKVFEVGYSESAEGTGFGLRIVEQIAVAHGWDITVTEGSDGGARFEITDVKRD